MFNRQLFSHAPNPSILLPIITNRDSHAYLMRTPIFDLPFSFPSHSLEGKFLIFEAFWLLLGNQIQIISQVFLSCEIDRRGIRKLYGVQTI
ncbi:hypothetical protein L1987_62009 [Smallanthus sonchifolius]|uniref:Uncharacterized protein n=1 Tax=Smallanthus sonchifolius TaxID=185202 RepID=A0ACB9C975_9ASTR|nr:hypothetical protein L1987_62009 [Smallanthus sonchifolius]